MRLDAGVSPPTCRARPSALVEGCDAVIQRDARRMQRAMERAWLMRKGEQDNAAVTEISQKETEKRNASPLTKLSGR